MNDPVGVLLQIGFIAILYLFLLWVARSALKDLRRPTGPGAADGRSRLARAPVIVVVGGGGLRVGASFAVNGAVTIGRSPQSEIRIDDGFASARHARVFERDGIYYVEDMGSTNGTYLNGRRLRTQEQLQPDDRIRIGDTELRYEQ